MGLCAEVLGQDSKLPFSTLAQPAAQIVRRHWSRDCRPSSTPATLSDDAEPGWNAQGSPGQRSSARGVAGSLQGADQSWLDQSLTREGLLA